MAEVSAIEWLKRVHKGVIYEGGTFNGWIGCHPVAPECANCYASGLNDKYKWVGGWKSGAPRYRTSASNWKQPLKWNREAAEWPIQRPVFGDSLCDWLDNEVPIEWLADYLRLIFDTPNLDWLLLTKRIENVYERLGLAAEHIQKSGNDPALADAILRWILHGQAPANVHLGLTVGSRNMLEHLPFFRNVPAKVRFLSMEPLLENVVSFTVGGRPAQRLPVFNSLGGGDDCWFDFDGIDGVIIGGESGQKHEKVRPMHPYWAERILMATHLYNARTARTRWPVKSFFKQWGDWMPYEDSIRMGLKPKRDHEHCWLTFSGEMLPYNSPEKPVDDAVHMVRIGKKRAGRLLRGREYNDLPTGIIRGGIEGKQT